MNPTADGRCIDGLNPRPASGWWLWLGATLGATILWRRIRPAPSRSVRRTMTVPSSPMPFEILTWMSAWAPPSERFSARRSNLDGDSGSSQLTIPL